MADNESSSMMAVLVAVIAVIAVAVIAFLLLSNRDAGGTGGSIDVNIPSPTGNTGGGGQ